MKQSGLVLTFSLLSACGLAVVETPEQSEDDIAPPPISLVLTDGEQDAWTLNVELTESKPIFFSRSNGDYRRETFSVRDDQAMFDRVGGFDTIIPTDDTTLVELSVTPYSGYIRGDYTPFIPFSDGGVALFTGQFELLPGDELASIEALNGNLGAWSGEQVAIPMTVKSNRTLLVGGERYQGEADIMIDGSGEYIYLGDATIVQGDAFSGVIDPGLPAWLRDSFDSELSAIFEALSDRFGYSLSDRATVLFAFRGYEGQGLSNSGGALPGSVLALETSGSALRDPNEQVRGHFRWFFAHEAAHLFQHQSGKIGGQEVAWIHEGAANAMAGRILVDRGLRDEASYEASLAATFARCADGLNGRTLEETMRAGRVGAYDCGEIIAIMSDAALPEHDLYDLWSTLITRSEDLAQYGADDYFAAMTELGASAEIVADLRRLTTEPVENAIAQLQSLLAAVGLDIVEADGRIVRIALPG